MQFRNDIQGLRALAFLLVFIFHLNSNWLPGGFLGVDVFFVISGYIMTSVIVYEVDNKKFSFDVFFLKRFKRIIPAYFFLLLITAIAGSCLYLYSDIEKLQQTLLRSTLFISNRMFANGNSYFGAKLSENPLLHTWSLAIEMQFYFILPILLYFFRKNILKIFIALIILLTIYSTYEINVLESQNEMYFSLWARVPEFLVGSVFFLIFRNGLDINRRVNNLISITSLTILLACAILVSEKTPFPGVVALIPCLASAFLLIIGNNIFSTFLAKKIPVYLGELSYSLYLWHFPLMAFIRYKNDEYLFNWNEIIIICVLTFFFAWVSYSLVENKFRKIESKSFFKIYIPLYAIFAIFSLCIPKIVSFRKIPKLYSERYFGKESHGTNKVQKFGAVRRDDNILLIGDSHAWSLKPYFDYIGKKNGFSFKTLTCDSYPALAGIKKADIPKDKIKFLESSKQLIPITQHLISESEIIILVITGIKRPISEYEAIENLSKQLKSNQKLILINSFPALDKNPLKLNAGFIKKSNYKFVKEESSYTYKRLKSISDEYDNVYFYDVSKGVITEDMGYINDTVAYYDSGHINTYGAVKMAKEQNNDFMKLFSNIRQSK